jgi:hypothetical protein
MGWIASPTASDSTWLGGIYYGLIAGEAAGVAAYLRGGTRQCGLIPTPLCGRFFPPTNC